MIGRVGLAVLIGAAGGLGIAMLSTAVVDLLRGRPVAAWAATLVLGGILMAAAGLGVTRLRRLPSADAAARGTSATTSPDPATNGHRERATSSTAAPVGRLWGVAATVLALIPAPFWFGDFLSDVPQATRTAIAVMPVVASVLPAVVPDRHRRRVVYLATFLLLPFALGFVFLYGPPFLVLLVAAIVQYRRSASHRPVDGVT